jgi:twinkle protein
MLTLTTDHKGSEFLTHTMCDNCGSSDANAIYSDGHTHCFSCNTTIQPNSQGFTDTEVQPAEDTKQEGLLQGEYQTLVARKLTEETCRKFGYITTTYRGEPVQAATYRNLSGKPIAQKLRYKDKRFQLIGETRKLPLFGSQLWKTGKKLVITEGEIDCMTVSQVQGHKWATVSLPQGSAGARRAIKDNWEYLDGFLEIILMFDMDDPGQKAAIEVAELLPIGKAKIATLPCKDANECLLQGKTGEIIDAIFKAREYRPDGIVAATDLREAVCVDAAASSIMYPYPGLNQITKGIRTSELVTVAAGSGVGKSTFIREIATHLHTSGESIGMIMLEESNKRTLLGLVGIHLSKNILVDRTGVSEDELKEAFDDLFKKRPIYLYDHFGSTDVDIICKRIEFMAKALDVKYIFLDHVSILISGLATNDERKLIDVAMTKLRTLVQELDICLFLVSHLRRPEGDKGHEDGKKVSIGHLRGSHSLAQLSDITLGLEKLADAPDSDQRRLVVLKNRFTGEVGTAGTLTYDRQTGRLTDLDYGF